MRSQAGSLKHPRSNALKLVAQVVHRILHLLQVGRVEVIRRAGAVPSVERLGAMNLPRVHVARVALPVVAQVGGSVVGLRLVGRVEVVTSAGRVETVEGVGIGCAVGVDAASNALGVVA